MTEAQKRFCEEYIIDFNATRAYKKAYPNCKKDETAKAAGSRLLTNVNVNTYIQELIEEARERNKITKDMVIEELRKLAFFDIRKLYNENGALKNIQELDDETAAAISSIETYQEFDGYGADREYVGDTKKVKTYDKKGSLELLGKHLGLFKDKVEIEQTKPFEVNIVVKKDK